MTGAIMRGSIEDAFESNLLLLKKLKSRENLKNHHIERDVTVQDKSSAFPPSGQQKVSNDFTQRKKSTHRKLMF